MASDDATLTDDPLWFKDAIIYELHVKTFFDSNGDGIGDFRGVIEKLDYLHDLGVTALWVLPFYPSPLRDDGYDIADYWDVNSQYGSLKDFKRFLRESQRRGMRVITELVINHTSDEHPWFQRARRAPSGSKYRNYYVWSDSPQKYEQTRVIFQDFEGSNWTWDPMAGQYYWHRFYHHQPDLNFDNVDVQKAVVKVLDFWLDMGIDGLRLDAIPYLYEREGTNCENLPETHAFLRELRSHVDRHYKNRMLLAEANQWPEDAAAYFGQGDECHMNFHFPLMPRMFMAVQLENGFPITDILEQTPAIPETCQWAVFLRNHDELTLEMVTDEDRDYMYRMYAADPRARINLGIRRRLAPLMQERQKVELMNGLLFSMPGTPVLYYGDEIGMGDNIYLGDRDGVRTPMQWSGDRNAGFSRANPQKLYLPTIIDPEYHYESTNVETQQDNPSSLLWWMKRLIALRNQHKVFGRGEIRILDPENPKVLAFVRTYREERVLVVANLSRFAQYTELHLSEFEGMVPVELFGGTPFPSIGELPYLLSLGAYQFYWFELTMPVHEVETHDVIEFGLNSTWEELFAGRLVRGLEQAALSYMRERRWFRGKSRRVKGATLTDALELKTQEGGARVALFRVEYRDHEPELYVLPLAYAAGEFARHLEVDQGFPIVARVGLEADESAGILYDPFARSAFGEALLSLFEKKRELVSAGGAVEVKPSKRLRDLRRDGKANLEPWASRAEQTNSSVGFGDQFILKVFRLLEGGESPELEVIDHLVNDLGFPQVPTVEGALVYRGPSMRESTLGVLQRFVPNQGDAWAVTLDALSRFFERVVPYLSGESSIVVPSASPVVLARQPIPEVAAETIGTFLPLAVLLGRRTAELHVALATSTDNPAFRPEPFRELHQRSIYQSARSRLGQTFKRLRRRGALDQVPEAERAAARELLGRQEDVDARFKGIFREKLEAVRTRVHGDFHLGQVLHTGKDFVIIDFEGEPTKPVGERRFKRSPLVDVAGILRSFHYATVAALRQGTVRAEDHAVLEPWADLWHRWVGATFLRSYFEVAQGAAFLPESEAQRITLLDFYMLDKCVYELAYEFDNRPSWLGIPLQGLRALLDSTDHQG